MKLGGLKDLKFTWFYKNTKYSPCVLKKLSLYSSLDLYFSEKIIRNWGTFEEN